MQEQKKLKKAKTKRYYFTKVHEEAIVRYAKTKDREERTELYIEYIQPAFNELVDKIIFTYRFTSLPNIDVLRDDCKIWLTTILDKFDPEKGSKAFSYFSVITKNWFIYKVKKTNQQNRREIQYENMPKYIENIYMTSYNQYDKEREKKEFWENFWVEIQTWNQENLRVNEKKVLEAVKILFEN